MSQFTVLTGPERRRRWSTALRLIQIAVEALIAHLKLQIARLKRD
jgi:hypothetical protein